MDATATTATTTTSSSSTASSPSSSSSKPCSASRHSAYPYRLDDDKEHRHHSSYPPVVYSHSPSTASAPAYQITPSSARPRTKVLLRSLVPRPLGPASTSEKALAATQTPPHPSLHESFTSGQEYLHDSRIKLEHRNQQEFGSRDPNLATPLHFTRLATTVAKHPSPLAHPSLNNSSFLPSHPGSPSWCRHLPKSRSLTAMTGSVKRSLSTPNVQQAAAIAEGASVPYSTDKRRNKLGYHRTSVACGHCRRRKIRCLLAKDDQQGRCSNCIRLKKECNFYPVETGDRRPRSMSKPDISSQDTGSSTSSPSPGLGGNHNESATGYPSSVPVTPTFDYTGMNAEDNLRHNSISSASGRFSGALSANVSRRPSLAQMHILPSTLKNEQGFLSPGDGLPRSTWELASQPEHHLSDSARAGLEDPSTAFWRLNTSPMATASFVPSQPNIETFQSFGSVDSADLHDERSWASQAPSRMGSIDHGMGAGYPYESAYSSDPDFNGAPGLCSASTSTASLTASLPETSQYPGDNQPDQFFMNQYHDQVPSVNGYNLPTGVKQELSPPSPMVMNDGRYVHVSEDSTYYHTSGVGLSHV